MSIQFRKMLLVTLIGTLYWPSNALLAADTSHSMPLKDARQEAQIWTTYQISPYLRGSDIQVKVEDGKVTLQGTVPEEVNKELAKVIASGVKGISSVDNQLIVDENYQRPVKAGERDYAEMVEDASVTAAIKSKLLWSKLSRGIEVDVDTYKGKVTLKGEASDRKGKEALTLLAKNTQGVVSVDNQLKIAEQEKTDKIKPAEQETNSVLADTWITTKVKSTYMYSSNVDSSDISVSTVDGIVSLEGQVKNGAERALAIELAKNIRGVKEVTSKKLVLL